MEVSHVVSTPAFRPDEQAGANANEESTLEQTPQTGQFVQDLGRQLFSGITTLLSVPFQGGGSAGDEHEMHSTGNISISGAADYRDGTNRGINNYQRRFIRLPHRHLNADSSSSNAISSPQLAMQGQDAFWLSSGPTSYFEYGNTCAFSWSNELHCLRLYVHRLRHTLEEDRLPWIADFGDARKMYAPRGRKEALTRLNLNIPYYAANYLQIFYALTLPFLLLYNPPFLLVLAASCLLLHMIAIRKRRTHDFGSTAVILGYAVSYRLLGHVLLASLAILFMFFDGLKTTALVCILNAALIVPHALWRMPTYFDDEDLEKLRPKLTQYMLSLLFIVLGYLEGDVDLPEDEGKKAAKEEMDRLGITHLYEKRRRLRPLKRA